MRKIFILLFSLLVVGKMAAQAPYCVANYSVACTSADFVNSVTFAGISNLNTGCASPGASNYSNYTSQMATVVPGNSYTITYAPGSIWGQSFGLYIDFNADGDFADANEFFNLPYVAGGGTGTSSITIPPGSPNVTTRMRIQCRFGTTATLTQADVCGAFSFGEIEDYSIQVGPPPPCPAPASVTMSAITASSATVAWTGPVNAASWNLEYGPAGFVQGTGTVVNNVTSPYNITGLLSNTNYTVYIKANCGAQGNSTGSAGNFLTLCGQPVVGDNLAIPFVIPSLPYQNSQDLNSACFTNATGSPNASKDTYYSFTTGPCEALITAGICTSSFNNILFVYEAGVATAVATDDNSCTSPNTNGALLTFTAKAFTTYYFLVEGVTTTVGTYTLDISYVPTALSVSYFVSEPTCTNTADGNISLFICGGQSPYQFLWDDGATTQNRTGLLEGRYLVRVRENSGAVTIDTVDIRSTTPQSYLVSNPTVDVCPGTTVNLEAGVYGGNVTPAGLSNFFGITRATGRFFRCDSRTTGSPVFLSPVSTIAYGGADFTPIGYQALQVGTNQFILRDTASGAAITMGPSAPIAGHQWSGLAFNAANNTLYATSTDGTTSQLYAVDYNTGANTPIAAMGINEALWLAIDNDGNAYTLDANTNSLYSVNLTTAATTVIGLVGFDAAQAQDADFDPVTNKLYATTFDPAINLAELRGISTANGASVFKSTFNVGTGVRVDAFAIAPYVGGYTHEWTNGAGTVIGTSTTASYTPTASETLTYTATDVCGNTSSQTVDINVPAPVTQSAVVTAPQCNTTNNGAINLSVTGGSSPVSYIWNNGFTTEDLTNLASSSYTVTITDACAVVTTATYNVVAPGALTPAVDLVTIPSCYFGGDGSIQVTTTGGTAPYTYIWSNGAVTEDLASVPAGTYTGSVTDANGCNYVAGPITVSQPAALNAVVDATQDALCAGTATGAAQITVTGGTAPYSFSWSDGSTNEDPSSLAPGNYNAVITDDNGCSLVASLTIDDVAALQAATSSTAETSALNDGTATVTATSGATPYSYAWATGATTATVSGLAPGAYLVTVTDNNGCQVVVEATVPFYVQPVGSLTIQGLRKATLSPNPTSDVANLDLLFDYNVENVTVEVYNTSLQRLNLLQLNNTSRANFAIDVTSFPSGSYFVRINVDGHVGVVQLIVM